MSLVAKREESFFNVEVINMNELVNYLTFVHLSEFLVFQST